MKGYSIHVGVGHVDPDAYGVKKSLNSSQNDAIFLHKVAKSYPYYEENFLLTNDSGDKPTSLNFFGILEEVIDQINYKNEEAYLLLSFSGHGSRAYPKDRSWRKSEFLCFYDRMVLEHEIKLKLLKLNPKAKCFIVLDACHGGGVATDFKVESSGFEKGRTDPTLHFLKKQLGDLKKQSTLLDDITILDNTFNDKNLSSNHVAELLDKVQKKNTDYKRLIAETPSVRNFKYFQSEVCFLGACEEHLKTKDGSTNSLSLFSCAIHSAWSDGRFIGNYNDFYHDLKKKFHPTTGPVISGAKSHFFRNSVPFYFNERNINHNIYKP